jgi:hypothetical protein
MSVETSTAGIDPRIALASSMQAAPGIYAVLVGSGMSSAANIPTGWQVLQDLVGQVARADNVDLAESGLDPFEWFAEVYGHEARYDELLSALASTDPARRALLRLYFDPPPEEGGPVVPTEAHRALARLCASGRVRVILTTNFDHLIERALDEVGVSAQVIATSDDLNGMTPLVHAPTTLIKLHGDYLASMRNTSEELAAYPDDLRKLLDRVLDEYGLLVVGWSAEYDTALASAISACPSRRYPTYWYRHQQRLTETGARLIHKRQAAVIDGTGADEFLTDLEQRIARLEQRARRRERPAAMWHYDFPPEQNSPPKGWVALPWLLLRAVAVMAPATLDDCSPITAADRQRLLATLAPAPITTAIMGLSSLTAIPSIVDDQEAPSEPKFYRQHPIGGWGATPDGYQSDIAASYRLGEDASLGVSALLEVRLPNVGMQGGRISFMLDVGLSVSTALMLGQVARLWRDGLVALTTLVPEALTEILPPYADISQVEIHAFAPTSDGQQHSRENSLTTRIAMQSLGQPSRRLSPAVGLAMRVVGGLAEREAADVIADAVERIALSHGFLDPTMGVRSLRTELGLAATR